MAYRSARWWTWRVAWWAAVIAVTIADGIVGSDFLTGGWRRWEVWPLVAACAACTVLLSVALDQARLRGW